MNKKSRNIKLSRRIRASLLYCACIFIVLLLTAFIVSGIFSLLTASGILNEHVSQATVKYSFAVSFVIVNLIASCFVIQYPLTVMQKILNAFEAITNGDYSRRIEFKKPQILKRTGEQFNNMAKQLESTEMLSNDFINNFSHEFKTPIASINGYAKLLKNESLSKDERDEYLDIIIQESARLSHLSHNVLTLSKLENQSILSNKTKINVSEQLRLAMGTLYQKLSEKNIEINFDTDEFYVQGNKELLEQVWINLIDNAIKFSPDGGEIKIDIHQADDAVFCTVSNSGNAIAPENAERLFDKFYQADKSHSTGGNGLGLAMVKKIIELHKGSVRLKKSDESSTVFEVSLPIE